MNEPHAIKERLLELAFGASTVAKIIVDENGNVVHINQKAHLLFSLNPKDIGRPLQDLEICSWPVELLDDRASLF